MTAGAVSASFSPSDLPCMEDSRVRMSSLRPSSSLALAVSFDARAWLDVMPWVLFNPPLGAPAPPPAAEVLLLLPWEDDEEEGAAAAAAADDDDDAAMSSLFCPIMSLTTPLGEGSASRTTGFFCKTVEGEGGEGVVVVRGGWWW